MRDRLATLLGPLGARLLLAFLIVAVGAVALLGGTTLLSGGHRITALVQQARLIDDHDRLEQAVRQTLAGTVALGAVLAVALALAVSAFVSQRIMVPVHRLSRAVRALRAGDTTARADLPSAVGELGELARTFDEMVEALARQERLRRQLVADVAHELRTPVSILQGHAEALLDGVAEPSQENLTSLHDEVLRLGRLIADLDVLAAADAAALQLRRQSVDLAVLADDTARLFAERLDAKSLRLSLCTEPAMVVGDPNRLRQVVTNLLSNAVKYTPVGGTVAVEVAPVSSVARLVVRDTGAGITAQDLPRVFERFWRGESARGVGGSGLGLPIVAELVQAHGGRVTVDSDPGEGTRVTVELPR